MYGSTSITAGCIAPRRRGATVAAAAWAASLLPISSQSESPCGGFEIQGWGHIAFAERKSQLLFVDRTLVYHLPPHLRQVHEVVEFDHSLYPVRLCLLSSSG